MYYFVSGFRKDISGYKERVEVSFYPADVPSNFRSRTRLMRIGLVGIVPFLPKKFAALRYGRTSHRCKRVIL